MMIRGMGMLIAVTGILGFVPSLQAQRTTEQFIPLGRSPGVSNVSSVIGTLEQVDSAAMTLRVASAQGTVQVSFTIETDIWRDRSNERLPSEVGSVADLVVGRTVEVKFLDPALRESADWIKVEVAAAAPG